MEGKFLGIQVFLKISCEVFYGKFWNVVYCDYSLVFQSKGMIEMYGVRVLFFGRVMLMFYI